MAANALMSRPARDCARPAPRIPTSLGRRMGPAASARRPGPCAAPLVLLQKRDGAQDPPTALAVQVDHQVQGRAGLQGHRLRGHPPRAPSAARRAGTASAEFAWTVPAPLCPVFSAVSSS